MIGFPVVALLIAFPFPVSGHEHFPILHHPSHLRRRPLGADLRAGRDLALPLANFGISRGGTTDGHRHRHLSRGESEDHRGNSGLPAGAGDQRHREHALHVLAKHCQRSDDAHGDFQAGNRNRQCPGAGSEPGVPGAAETTRGSATLRRVDGEVLAGHDLGGASLVAQ